MSDSNFISSEKQRWLHRSLLAVLKCTVIVVCFASRSMRSLGNRTAYPLRVQPPLRLSSGQACFAFEIKLEEITLNE